MNRKRLGYFDNGVRLLWIVDCVHRTVAVYTSMADVVVLGEDDMIDGGQVVDGFSASVQDFFADLDLLLDQGSVVDRSADPTDVGRWTDRAIHDIGHRTYLID